MLYIAYFAGLDYTTGEKVSGVTSDTRVDVCLRCYCSRWVKDNKRLFNKCG